jgi:hypothetical protein
VQASWLCVWVEGYCTTVSRQLSLFLGPAPTLSPSFLLAQAIFKPNLFPYKYPNIPNLVILHTYLPMKIEHSVPKRRHIKFRRREITQKKLHSTNIVSTAIVAFNGLPSDIIYRTRGDVHY